MVGERMGWCMFSDAYCVIGNVLYSAYDGVFRWYDTEERMWSFLHVWLDYLGSLVIEGFDWINLVTIEAVTRRFGVRRLRLKGGTTTLVKMKFGGKLSGSIDCLKSKSTHIIRLRRFFLLPSDE
ncbi:unnamed protein product [Brassica oleracea]